MTKEEKHAEYLMYKTLGICTQCRTREAMGGYTRCPECSEKEAEYNRMRYSTAEYREHNKTYKKELYRKRREAHLCIVCGKPSGGYEKCDYHRRKVYQNRLARTGHITREQRDRLGLCILCGKEKRFPGKTICMNCYDQRRRKTYEWQHKLGT